MRIFLCFFFAANAIGKKNISHTSKAKHLDNMSGVGRYFALAEWYFGQKATTTNKFLVSQRKHGWVAWDDNDPGKVKKLSSHTGLFFTIGVEGVGHHVLMSLPRGVCGHCGGKQSFSRCGSCCTNQRSQNVNRIWRCNKDSVPDFPSNMVLQKEHNIILVRDPTSSMESILRRFWLFGTRNPSQSRREFNDADTLVREEDVFLQSLVVVATLVKGLNRDRTLFIPFELLATYPHSVGAALSNFLQLSSQNRIELDEALFEIAASDPVEDPGAPHLIDCVGRNIEILPTLREYFSWLSRNESNREDNDRHAAVRYACNKEISPRSDYECMVEWRLAFGRYIETRRTEFNNIIPAQPQAVCMECCPTPNPPATHNVTHNGTTQVLREG